MKCNEIRHVYMKSDHLWMNLFQLVRILVSLALDEHAKQYLLALFPGWLPRLQQFHMYSLQSFLVCIQVLSVVKVSLLWPILYKKVCTFTMCEVKRKIKHTWLAIHREHSKQSMIMHLSDSHAEAIFTSQLKNKEKNGSMLLTAKCVPFENIKRVSSC